MPNLALVRAQAGLRERRSQPRGLQAHAVADGRARADAPALVREPLPGDLPGGDAGHPALGAAPRSRFVPAPTQSPTFITRFTDGLAFLVYLTVEEHLESEKARKIGFVRTVRAARCVPVAEVHALYDRTFALTQLAVRTGAMTGREALEAAFAHRPGMLRVAVIDECAAGTRMPFFAMIPAILRLDADSLGRERALMPADGDWLKVLRRRLAVGDNARKLASRKKALARWIESEVVQEHVRTAGLHALNLRKQPNRLGQRRLSHIIGPYLFQQLTLDTDVLIVSLNCREEIVSVIQRRSNFYFTVHKARAVPASELDEKFARSLGQFSTNVVLEPGERFLRVLLVDENSDEFPPDFALVSCIISGERIFPFFNPEWLSIFKENARL
ncbi:hypothetical protein HWV62_28730 [Athelia sp. TMB]|nr:hypothetical protein HWV62_28730 [Athelia sp. TMB]